MVTGSRVAETISPIPSAVRVPIKFYPIALDRVRYVGEPVAVVIAEDRYVAEDALELISVDYEALPATADPEAAMADNATYSTRMWVQTWCIIGLSNTAIRTERLNVLTGL